MKKMFVLFMAIVMAVAFAACNQDNPPAAAGETVVTTENVVDELFEERVGNPCETDGCQYHPETGSNCHCHGRCGTPGCECHGAH